MRERVLIPRGLGRTASAEYLGIGTTMFDDLVKDGSLPKPKRVRSRVIWDRYELDAAFDQLDADPEQGGNPWDEVLSK